MNTHLYRSRDDRMLAGVAGGLAELWDADPSLVRLLWALLVIFTGGIALLVYIVMAIVVPEEPDELVLSATTASPPDVGDAGSSADMAGGLASAPVLSAREARIAARRQARAQRRAQRGSGTRSGPLIVGTLFILFGAWFLVREYLPALDWDWFWPATLIVVGALVLVVAVRPSSNNSQPTAGGGS